MSDDILSRPAPIAGDRIHYGPGEWNFGDLRLPSTRGPHPLVVVIHGGFWRAQYDLLYMAHACAALATLGFATWNIEYRRIGNPGGGWPGTFLDIAAAADFARDLAHSYDLDLSRVVAVGHSAGGQMALWLAGRHRIPQPSVLYSASPLPIKGAVSLAGVVDLRRGWELRLSNEVVQEFMGGAPASVPQRYRAGSPTELLPVGLPQWLVHGTNDANVPYQISKSYCDLARSLGDDATLVTLPGAGHFEVVDPQSREWPSVAGALRAALGEQ
ncbi:MAG: alpha/beta fold hydrolase [Chloroflexi bacterium]|nr:alpha/beta fold hydrolase [Chloroflexota bacterium]